MKRYTLFIFTGHGVPEHEVIADEYLHSFDGRAIVFLSGEYLQKKVVAVFPSERIAICKIEELN